MVARVGQVGIRAGLIGLVIGFAALLAVQPVAPFFASILIAVAIGFVGLSLRYLEIHGELVEGVTTARVGALLLVGLTFYELTFNFVPNHLRLDVAGVVAVALSLFGFYLMFEEVSARSVTLLVLIGVLIGVSLFGTVMDIHSVDAVSFFRIWFPLLIACGCVLRPMAIPARVAGWSAVVMVVAGTMISYAHGKKILNNALRFAPFTGGADGVHSSAYLLMSCIVVINECRRRGAISPLVAWTSMGIGLAGVLGLRVATAMVMLLVYFGLRMLLDHGSIAWRVLLVAGVTSALLVGYYYRVQMKQAAPAGHTSVSWNTLSSGRLLAWDDRIAVVDGETTSRLLLGGGIGAGTISTSAWNGALKSSHEDFLTVLIDDGFLTLAAYTLFIGCLMRIGGREAWPAIVALVVGSAISNALFERPMIAPVLWVGVAIAAQGSLVRAPAVAEDRPGQDRPLWYPASAPG